MQNIEEVIISKHTGDHATIGIITLNRTTALNALNLDMIHTISNALLDWQQDSSVAAVVIQGAGEKAFCAGGDIKTLYLNGKQNPEQCLQFFYNEYRLNNLIKNYCKPYIALMHGITMGGGIGVSIHGSHRVAAQNLMFAMPESNIGFFTDVGASYFLSRCPDQTGYFLGLTGNRINCRDALSIRLVDHIVADQDHKNIFSNIITALGNTKFSQSHANNLEAVTQTLNVFCTSSDRVTAPHNVPDVIKSNLKDIKTCFKAQHLSHILNNLQELNNDWSKITLQNLDKKSPTSLMVIFELLKRAEQLSFSDCMRMEYSVANGFLHSNDFYEGVRAVIIDKDNNPSWDKIDLDANDFQFSDYFNDSVALNLAQ